MPPELSAGHTHSVTGVSNAEFLRRYAKPGRVGLSGGLTLIDRAICRAERHLDARAQWGVWSHAFVFEGPRLDGHQWLIESDLQIQRKHIQLGVQENRVAKYHDEQLYTNLAVLDFGLSEAQTQSLLAAALELVASREPYSVRELFGTLLALRHKSLRAGSNVFARERAMYCSAFVQHLFRVVGLDLVPGVDPKNASPEDLARTAVPHLAWVLQRQAPASKLARIKTRLRRIPARSTLFHGKKP